MADPFTRWAESHAIPKEHWHLCRAAWDAGAHARQLTIASHLELARAPHLHLDVLAAPGGTVTTATRPF